ncbi:putative C6 finger domain protein [Thelonectria olida]|uniref:C6 finger domain protein n=1 Tax=Thelonectria olida TaxID=1576542 RepID=A0A9P8W171_9HYPO|nr:putative C6 finger domain protein [Thelonectria olida]
MVMKAGRYATSRQKNCQRCSAAKAKCDRRVGGCARCATRSLPCVYPSQVSTPQGNGDTGEEAFASPLSATSTTEHLPLNPYIGSPAGIAIHDGAVQTLQLTPGETATVTSPVTSTTGSSSFNSYPTLTTSQLLSIESETLDFSNLGLFCPIQADDIKTRWLNSYVPDPTQKIKAYPIGVRVFIHRILKSYAATAVRGQGLPPFVHPSQLGETASRAPLSTCLSLVRICEKPLSGSEGVATDVLEREMNNVYEHHGTYDDMTLLAAFQAYLIYSMVLHFRLSQGPNSFLRQAMMNLQDLASLSSKRGLVCEAERRRERPRLEAWVAAEAKRRTLYTMYLFDSLLLAEDGLPTFLGTELYGLPAPANKALWNAKHRRGWETTYNIYLTDWPEDDFRIDELWPVPEDLAEVGLVERNKRVDRWIEKVDEFGTMMYAVTSCTHGG